MLYNDQVQVVDSDVRGPLGHGLSALLLGRSSTSKQGVFVLPGVIDADYTGPIRIMVKAFFPPLTIMKGTKIAQLVPFRSAVCHSIDKVRADKGFGSTDDPQVFFTIPVTNTKPTRWVTFQGPSGFSFTQAALIDTGADVSIIPKATRPTVWPLESLSTKVQGMGGLQTTSISLNFIQVIDQKDPQLVAHIRPDIVGTPILLLGRDCLAQRGLTLTSSPFL